MAYFDDFEEAIESYPADSVVLSIVDRAPVAPATAGAVNVNEVWSFQVRVANNGPLNMTNVALHIEGQNGAQVGTAAAGPFTASILPPALAAVNGHSTQDSVNYFLRAPAVIKPAGTSLVRAHISGWDANLDHVLNSHSGHADPPAGSYADQVFP